LLFSEASNCFSPFIIIFIPANKSLDSVASRVERHIGTMIAGTWLKRRGENFTPTNIAGGQVMEYETTPPTQMPHTPIPSHVFAYIQFLNSVIEEQGASTAALSQLPPGVKSGIAIESLKATEYANLKIAGMIRTPFFEHFIGGSNTNMLLSHFLK